jgi:hypothetical protein
MAPYDAMLQRIRAEYLEMPGLQLTFAQAQRLCAVDPALCKMVLDALVDAKFLTLQANGVYARFTARPSRLHSAKPDLVISALTPKVLYRFGRHL